jgi:flavin reductase (DIM6/NTAB) family NADH-FMN oxidoreductase RutF
MGDTHFYEPKDGHRLPHDPFKAIVAPRPIGWISTVDAEGRPNLAPYSFFNAFCDSPPAASCTTPRGSTPTSTTRRTAVRRHCVSRSLRNRASFSTHSSPVVQDRLRQIRYNYCHRQTGE